MGLELFVIILGIITYFVIKQSVATITKTPVWLLWLVIMSPAFIWTGWSLAYGQDARMPVILVLGPFLISPILYWWLVDKGRIKPSQNQPSAVEKTEPIPPIPKPVSVRPITADEEKSLRDCFPWGVYYLQNIDYRPQAILCRGKLRSPAEKAYEVIKENVEKVFGDRFLVLLQESIQGQPFFALVANPGNKSAQSKNIDLFERPIFALILLILTLFTTTLAGVEISGQSLAKLQGDGTIWLKALPYSLGIITILGIHELSHYFAAVHYKIKTTLPHFLPIPFFLGTFGAFIQMKSPIPHRKALFDISIAGPLGGFIITLPLLLWGLSLSEVVAIDPKSSLLSFDSLNPRFSFLFALLAKSALGSGLTVGKAIDLHPLAVAGYMGLIVTALNLMPVGQLDGGHIVHAMYGQKTAIVIGQITRFLMLGLALVEPDLLLWAILLLFMPVADQPALNDVTELDNKRDLLGLFSLVLLLMILLPLPGAIASWLSI
ncbi:MAG: hypothetical protein N5P05_003271 [Chroococcopsis gigantea SAG 12.99]|jgi:membrane-associated protease RseP (regulator of RpoE activity)|nr:site-2 protease family protein [Chlorogloea purpurea SAG 13.99]MDV3001665.1 hypothetical protein [Chroococcopsis gigantea SAG 12.99]